ncbi:ABC transporter ATP-binding protein [Olsenella sp. An270]|uniref:ABC transporter ATP-binding protein n=1 Tax=Olsenella sp. An270 TaxID=1965615 RepID=UPI000B377DB7|nr:ABC transporter ATP-binding protein [Olsenella sp. An270]OUO58483.1 methionine ABC transporter ATP-binding protein [Olsenella sp. An270]
MTYQTPAQSGGTLLEVKDLSMFYLTKSSCVRAVNEVSFTVREGETFGLVGESGCGKSTAVRSLIRLLPEAGKIVSGTITYKGQDVTAMSEREVRRLRGREIGMIFQDPMTSLNPVTKVSKQFYESLKAEGLSRREMRERAIELLRLVDIPEPEQRLDNYVHEMSGGMRQRVMIAIALASRPKLLLADEPTTALDVTIQDQIIALLNSLRAKLGMSVLLVTHDLGVVNEMCDHVAVMYAGRIVETADTHGLLHDSRHPYTCGLINSLPAEHDTRTRLEPIHGAPPNLAQEIVGCPFAPRCPYATDVCRSVLPEMSEVAPGHQVRCHHADPTDRARMTEPTSSVTLQGGAA